jgi:hypothetical protein
MKTEMKDREGLMLLSLALAIVARDGSDDEVAKALTRVSYDWWDLAQKYAVEVIELYNETAATEKA